MKAIHKNWIELFEYINNEQSYENKKHEEKIRNYLGNLKNSFKNAMML